MFNLIRKYSCINVNSFVEINELIRYCYGLYIFISFSSMKKDLPNENLGQGYFKVEWIVVISI